MYILCTHPFGTDQFGPGYPAPRKKRQPILFSLFEPLFFFYSTLFVVIRQMFTFYLLLRLEFCWTLTFRSLQVIKVLQQLGQPRLPQAHRSRPCRLTSLDIRPGSHPPILQRSPTGDPRLKNLVLKASPQERLKRPRYHVSLPVNCHIVCNIEVLNICLFE